MKKLLVLTFSICLLHVALFAQVPNAFKYQAIARNSAGEVLSNEDVKFVLSLLQGDIDGNIIYAEEHQVTTNSYGVVALNIGQGTVLSGNFETIDWSTGAYFIQVKLNDVLLGTSQLLSVPYAKYAEKAGSSTSANYQNLYHKPFYFNTQVGNDNVIQYRPDTTKLLGITMGKYSDVPDLYAFSCYNWTPNRMAPLKLGIYAQHLYLNDAEGWRIYNVGIGVSRYDTPAAKLEVANGDIYLSDIEGGVIMTAPNGSCWRVTIDNDGNFVRNSIPCPEFKK